MQKCFSISAMTLMIAAAPAVAQTSPAPPQPAPAMGATGQQAMDQQMMNPNAMGQTTPGQNSTMPGTPSGTMAPASPTMDNTAPVPADQMASGQTSMDSPAMATPAAGQTATTAANDGPTSPDGTPAFGIEPYFGIVGGYHHYDRDWTNGTRGFRYNDWLIGGVLGVNVPLGPLFVGVEGHGARGFNDIRWEYGVRGRGGVRIGDSGLIYASAGYTWSDALNRRGFADRKDWTYGLGVEAGPRDIGLGGITSNSGVRFRLSVETADFNSIRPMGGVIFHF